MHGEVLKARCEGCGRVAPWRDDLDAASACPTCTATGGMRPHVVWFGETPLEMERITGALAEWAPFPSIGTSGNVYPPAALVQEARHAGGAYTAALTQEPPAGPHPFHE